MRLLFVVLLVAAVLGLVGYYKLFRELPAEHFASDEQHFLYGSTGTEAGDNGVPYWIWLVLPRVFPDLLPGSGGWASVGFFAEEGHPLPIGLSRKTVGIDRVGINCAFCHAGTYRLEPTGKTVVVATAPSTRMDPQAYAKFLQACAQDPRFAAGPIMAEIAKNTNLSWLDRQIYRYIVIPLTKRELLKQRRVHTNYGWMYEQPPWGRGRIDPFNPIKYRLLNQPVDGTIGNSDMQPLWNQNQHTAYQLHWDGLNNSLNEVILTSALGDGASKKWVDSDWAKPEAESSLKRIRKFLTDAPAPKYPMPIDAQVAAKGKVVYDRDCAQCHAFGGARTGRIEPLDSAQLNTDRHRLDMWTENAAKAYNEHASGYSWKMVAYKKTNGYVNVPLDGIWLRAPYLHNGSVPTLADLLEAPSDRPKIFYRGYDVIDPAKVGFLTDGPEAERTGFRFDTAVAGNGNGGHLWGTALATEEKRALVEFMKTL